MIGIQITRDVALRVLTTIEREMSAEHRTLALQVPNMSPGAYRMWVDGQEEKLATIAALRDYVSKLPSNAVLKEAEVEAGHER